MNEKSFLRRTMLESRSRLSETETVEMSIAAQNRVLSLKAFNEARLVMCYMGFRNEVGTELIINACLKNSIGLCLPFVSAQNGLRKLLCYRILSFEHLRKGSYGIMEPVPDESRLVYPQELEFILVPGVAFDIQKNRMGYGVGYYDSFLAGTSKGCIKAGLAYEMQIVPQLPVEMHDIKMDLIVTEKRDIL